MIGISNESLPAIADFIEDQGITFPVLHDNQSVYGLYNLPGAASPYPRDFILDEFGIVRMAKTEYEPGTMIAIIETLLNTSPVALEPRSPVIPEQQDLLTVYPNPFNPESKISVLIQEAGQISLRMFDIRGRQTHEIINDHMLTRGQHQFDLGGENLSSGIYFLVLEQQSNRHIQKVVKLR